MTLLYLQSETKSLNVTIMDEVYILNSTSWVDENILNFEVKIFFLHCILLIAKIKLFQTTIGKKFFNHLTTPWTRANSDFMVLDVYV